MRPSSNASSSSLTKTPRLPISPNGLLRSRSPAVVTGTSANSSPGPRRRSTASSACLSARRLPLEPILRTTTLLDCRLLEAHDRLVQELVDDLARQGLDCVSLSLREPRPPPPPPPHPTAPGPPRATTPPPPRPPPPAPRPGTPPGAPESTRSPARRRASGASHENGRPPRRR